MFMEAVKLQSVQKMYILLAELLVNSKLQSPSTKVELKKYEEKHETIIRFLTVIC